jgi:hypothetical protein
VEAFSPETFAIGLMEFGIFRSCRAYF